MGISFIQTGTATPPYLPRRQKLQRRIGTITKMASDLGQRLAMAAVALSSTALTGMLTYNLYIDNKHVFDHVISQSFVVGWPIPLHVAFATLAVICLWLSIIAFIAMGCVVVLILVIPRPPPAAVVVPQRRRADSGVALHR